MPPETTETGAKMSTMDQRISIFDYLNDTEAGKKKREKKGYWKFKCI